MKTLIMDLLDNSLNSEYIGYSVEIFAALKELKQFNYDKIYSRRNLFKNTSNKESYESELKKQFCLIFDKSLNDLEKENYKAPIFKEHIEYIDDKNYSTYYKPLKEEGKLPLIARDYIAGMSDKYFNEIFNSFRNKI
jgi:dGTPase